MGTFTKKYYHPKNDNQYLVLTWEHGYKHVEIYFKDQLLKTVANPAAFVQGIAFNHEELGKIKISFTTVGPKKLEVKVNRKKYITVNKIDLGYDYSGMIAVFTSLAVFAGIEITMLGGSVGFNFSNPMVTITMIIYLIPLLTYGVTSYLLSKKKAWAYFMGGSMFTFFSILILLGMFIDYGGAIVIIILVIRFGILAYVLSQFPHLWKEVKKQRKPTGLDDGLVDSFKA